MAQPNDQKAGATPSAEDLIKELKSRFADLLDKERTRLTAERDFLLAVQKDAGLGLDGRRGSAINEFGNLFLVEQLDDFNLP